MTTVRIERMAEPPECYACAGHGEIDVSADPSRERTESCHACLGEGTCDVCEECVGRCGWHWHRVTVDDDVTLCASWACVIECVGGVLREERWMEMKVEREVVRVTTHTQIRVDGVNIGSVFHSDKEDTKIFLPYSAVLVRGELRQALDDTWATFEEAENALLEAHHRRIREAETLPPPAANGGA